VTWTEFWIGAGAVAFVGLVNWVTARMARRRAGRQHAEREREEGRDQ
jgi:hypothetical protein